MRKSPLSPSLPRTNFEWHLGTPNLQPWLTMPILERFLAVIRLFSGRLLADDTIKIFPQVTKIDPFYIFCQSTACVLTVIFAQVWNCCITSSPHFCFPLLRWRDAWWCLTRYNMYFCQERGQGQGYTINKHLEGGYKEFAFVPMLAYRSDNAVLDSRKFFKDWKMVFKMLRLASSQYFW